MSKDTKYIRDSVHGDLCLNETEIKLIDTPQVQRIRRITQLGFISLVYPGANHSRFEHSIGTMYLGSKLAQHLELEEHEKKLVRAASLLHDVGHGPFSHASEPVLGVPHEKLTAKVIKHTCLFDILNEEFNVNEIIKIINGDSELGPLVSGELDVDRMDYLMRDSHYTGVAYGIIDVERIITNMKLDNYLLLNIKAVQAAEATLVARYFMYPSVYQHHTTRIVNAMFRRCLKKSFKEKIINKNKIYEYDEIDIITILRNSEGTIKDFVTRLDNRNLLKTAHSIKLNQFKNPNDIFKIEEKELRKAEEEISEETNIDRDNIIINIADYPRFDEMKTQVYDGEDIYHLNEISSIVGALKIARFNYPDISLYIPKEDKNKIKKFKFENYLDLPEKSENKFDTMHLSQRKLI
ncbi:HD domain-containing protein [Methanobrevibacter filiformis]|uniref:HD domain-containing protein n=1 Tax=Methanobrevibacter filiformis TaxID=55758 RepID=UPI0008354DB0|nr:HD domain-containing protein [Methanobrevibacter filiformis]